MQRSSNKRPLITEMNPRSPISEAYRTLRTNIDFSSVDGRLQTIMLTSAGPEEGKSTTVSNLAIAYAQADRKVLLIDADLRKPTIHHTFFKSNQRGLSNVLVGHVSSQDVIQESDIANLDILTSGPIPPNPAEMLSSKRMAALIEELKERYEMILIDTPPALAVADAQIVSTQCDGVILILNAGIVKREAAVKVKASLEHVKARILGVVLNNVDRKSGESYYYYYYSKNS